MYICISLHYYFSLESISSHCGRIFDYWRDRLHFISSIMSNLQFGWWVKTVAIVLNWWLMVHVCWSEVASRRLPRIYQLHRHLLKRCFRSRIMRGWRIPFYVSWLSCSCQGVGRFYLLSSLYLLHLPILIQHANFCLEIIGHDVGRVNDWAALMLVVIVGLI